MGMPRTAIQIHYDPEVQKGKSASWGCWDCGNEDSRVIDVDKDEEHIRVRRRRCTRCGGEWDTEEKRITRGSFFSRAEKRRFAHFRKTRYASRRCHVCPERYMAGQYKQHCATSEAHAAKMALSERRQAERRRRFARLHARATRAVKKSKEGTAVCDRCGERYDLSVPYPLRTHRGTDPVHRQVIRDEHNARRDRRRKIARRGHRVQSAA